ncbi:MAG TPA: nickel-dependent lactate racemase [Spirochaetes bacterium]|nr:nickel-dependent lactate racemase [Spirochaetota bacterium]
MTIEIARGKRTVPVRVPESNLLKVLTMNERPPVSDPAGRLRALLEKPTGCAGLVEMARGRSSACVLICDITRPVPNRVLLPSILDSLHLAGLGKEDILVLIATGMHRPNLGDELVELVGPEIALSYNVQNHYALDADAHRSAGLTSHGTDALLDRRFLDADLKIATGFIEPHLMAGYSGGRKLVIPGVASLETVKRMHRPEIIDHPRAREGVLEGNPFHEEAVETARMAGLDFIVNVALNERREITGIFAGDMEAAHLEGVDFVRGMVRSTAPAPADIVITGGGGYPLDATWYQTIKGLTAAMPVVKEGGTIIIVSSCDRGIGSEEFAGLVRRYSDLDRFMADIYRPEFFVIDQWQFHEYVRAAKKARIVLVADGLSPEEKQGMHIAWSESVEDALAAELSRYGGGATVTVIPRGPYVLAEAESAP